ncbi:MAG: aspartate/tyrosine/aromatic aminotransferase [Planctomycetales bacterium]|nr:aspartate/tyrosine/aromatic aminotransferase [Planctomycetales bacterium]MCA9168177.1 aspartate/tyrosine/aromatic aminotransferase [Planctomycetales bacterium]
MFESIEVAPADPILGLGEAFQRDPNPNKINLSVGVYKDERGQTPVLECVKQAEQRLIEQEKTKSYLAISGLAAYDSFVQQLLFGADSPLIAAGRCGTLQSPGGTGALRVAADFLGQRVSGATVWCSSPTWANHPKIFEAAGLRVANYDYLAENGRDFNFDGMLAKLRQVPAGDVVLLHACCHNPSGVDPSLEQWQQIADCLVERKLLPLIDFAYQGFGKGLEDDASGLRTIASVVPEFFVASSFSKNFGLYRERVGALTVVAADSSAADAVMSQLKVCVRTNYSNPPAHGGAVVETILGDPALSETWRNELTVMRERIHEMRQLFVQRMREYAPQRDFSFLLQQAGMFSFSGLTPEQVDRLRDEHAIYIVRSGRINVAGITPQNVEPLCRAIASVL